jgi:hypothetical protein
MVIVEIVDNFFKLSGLSCRLGGGKIRRKATFNYIRILLEILVL